MSTDDAGPLGVDYQCFFGANAHLGLTEDDSFAMEDCKGRSWICHPIKREDVEALDLFKDLPAIKEADEKIGEKTAVRILFCETMKELPTKLADSLGSWRSLTDGMGFTFPWRRRGQWLDSVTVNNK